MNLADNGADVGLGEDDYCVDVGKGGENLGAFFGGHQRAALSLQRTYRFIRIQGDYQAPAEFFGRMEITHVPDVQKVEASIRERDTVAGGTPRFRLASQLIAPENL
jgi:hypothetical protein